MNASRRDEQFREYVTAHRAGLLRTASLLTAGDVHHAEDVVQSTLTKLYLAWPRFQAADNPQGYVRRMLANVVVDESRRPWRREVVRDELPERPTAGNAAPDVDALYAALEELPPRMRVAIVFRYFHDLSVAETAQVLHCSQGTVKSQTARALTHLRRRLGEDLSVPDEPSPLTPSLRSFR